MQIQTWREGLGLSVCLTVANNETKQTICTLYIQLALSLTESSRKSGPLHFPQAVSSYIQDYNNRFHHMAGTEISYVGHP